MKNEIESTKDKDRMRDFFETVEYREPVKKRMQTFDEIYKREVDRV